MASGTTVYGRTGDRLAGLVPRRRGGGRRLHPIVQGVLGTAIEEFVLVANPKSSSEIRDIVRVRLTEMDCAALVPCERTVERWMRKISKQAKAAAQLGSRAAHALGPYREGDPDDAPPRGEYPMQVVHIDSTEPDLETVCPFTGHRLGRLQLTSAVDAATGRALLDMLHYEAPSAATILRFLRRFVERYGWLPEAIVLDQGPEFFSEALQRFAGWAGVAIYYRPPRQPRFGSPVERYFTVVARFMRIRSGQTTSRKNPRALSREKDPSRFAMWDMASLAVLLDEARGWLNGLVLIATHLSREQAWADGLVKYGVRPVRLVNPRDTAFLAWTLPLVRGDTRVVNAVVGSVSVNYLTYLHPELRVPELDHAKVEVRWDPEDMGHVFVCVGERWLEARARELRHVRVVSAEEWTLYGDLYRQRAKVVRKGRATGSGIAELILHAEEDEQRLTARLKAQARFAEPIQTKRQATGVVGSAAASATPSVRLTPAARDGDEPVPEDLLSMGERDAFADYWQEATND